MASDATYMNSHATVVLVLVLALFLLLAPHALAAESRAGGYAELAGIETHDQHAPHSLRGNLDWIKAASIREQALCRRASQVRIHGPL